MKIKKVDDKPMVIHTKQKAKLHTHEPKQTAIKGSNVYTVDRDPTKKKADNGKYRKSTVHQVQKEGMFSTPRSYSRTVKAIQEEVPVKAYYVQNDIYHLGETTGTFNGVTLPVYDRERTICDCFKYRTKLDNEIFNKGINAYVSDEKKNLATLSKYAKEMGVYKKMMNVMELLWKVITGRRMENPSVRCFLRARSVKHAPAAASRKLHKKFQQKWVDIRKTG